MAYRDDRVAMLARADALERALEKAEQRQAQAEAERDALAAESQVLRTALVRAVSGRVVRYRPRRQQRAHPAAPVAFMLIATLTFVLVAISLVTSDRRAARERDAPAATASSRDKQDRVYRALSFEKRIYRPRWDYGYCGMEKQTPVREWPGHPASIDGIELLPW